MPPLWYLEEIWMCNTQNDRKISRVMYVCTCRVCNHDPTHWLTDFILFTNCQAIKTVVWLITIFTEKKKRGCSCWISPYILSRGKCVSEAVSYTHLDVYKRQLEGRPIAWKESMKYLGVRLDRRLSFNAHVTDTLNKARGVRAKIFPPGFAH